MTWKLWIGSGSAALVAAFAIVAWTRGPEAPARPAAEPAASAAAQAAAAQAAEIGGAPAPARERTQAPAGPAAPGATAQSGGYALTEGPRYRPAVAEGGLGYEGYQIFGQAVAGDVDGDGRDDVVVAAADNSVQVFLQQPQGGLPSSPQVWRFPHDGRYRQMKLQLIDLNADGALDILASRDRSESTGLAAGLNVLLSDGHGGLSLRQWTGDATLGSTMDVDQDGLDDIVTIVYRSGAAGECAGVSGGTDCTLLRVRYSDGQGGIRETAELPLGKPVAQVVDAVDFDGDGRRDFVYTDADTPYGTRRAMWRRQLPQGGLGEATVLGSWPGFMPLEATVGDFNGDGRPDIATGGYYDGAANVYAQLAGGGLSAAQPYAAQWATSQLLAADFDGDGRADLVSVQKTRDDPNPQPQAVLAYHLQRDGALSPAQWNGSSHGPTQIGGHRNELAHGDFNGDGCRDVAIAADYEGVMFYYGSGCAQAATSSGDCRIEQTAAAPAAALASLAASASAPVAPLPPVRVQTPPLWSKPQARAQLRVPMRMQGASQAQARGRVTSRPKRVFIAPARTHWRMLRKLRNR
ncbi:FG-GAP repeat domain-containing protein [Lysobacter enzymogenes]|uniref:FG-GAP repeat domain-containing protein n=1 Tax=Lysobacter enzymogenes TaxID=69 RepID=UPI000F4B82D3|nr:VCBS repeat-containing protein [Lysobacter enzymogenes]